MAATPAIRAAEEAGISFTLHEYEHDPHVVSYGDEAAAKLDVDAARLFKTLVVSVDGALHVACVPVAAQLDLDPHDLVRLTDARVHEIASAR